MTRTFDAQRATQSQLKAEEYLAYEFARQWRDPNYHPDLRTLAWTEFAQLLTHNRMAILAHPILERARVSIPDEATKLLNEQKTKYRRSAKLLGAALSDYLRAADSGGIKNIVLKGLWLCEKIYHDPALRPGADIDILVPRDQVAASMDVLRQQNIGEFWPNLLADEYFYRHHLHQQRSSPDLKVWFEIHWALDHPYTLLTIDYAAIFQRAHAAELLGAPICELDLPDLLLSLSIHLVKHAVYLPSLIEREDLARIILADGMLMYYLDVAEIIKLHRASIDWDQTIRLAREWGAVDILGAVLRVCNRYFDAAVPDSVLSALAVSGAWPVTRYFMARAADEELAAYEGRRRSGLWHFILASNGAFIMRPVRVFETASYFFPPSNYLQRKYGRTNPAARLKHYLVAVAQAARFGMDTIYFGFERYLRLKRMGESTSLSNKLDTKP